MKQENFVKLSRFAILDKAVNLPWIYPRMTARSVLDEREKPTSSTPAKQDKQEGVKPWNEQL